MSEIETLRKIALEDARRKILAIENADVPGYYVEIGDTQKRQAIKYLEDNPRELPVYRIIPFGNEIIFEYSYNDYVERSIHFESTHRRECIWVWEAEEAGKMDVELVSEKNYPYHEGKDE